MTNIAFLIVGLILGFLFSFILELVRERRLSEKSAGVIKNEIEVCIKDIKEDFKLVKSAKEGEKPEGWIEEKLFLIAFLLSASMYSTEAYDVYLSKIYLFRSNTQKAIMGFYSIIKKIRGDKGSIETAIRDKDIPGDLIKDLYKKQHKYRKKALEEAKLCSKELEKEKKIRSIYEFIKLEGGMNKAQKKIISIWLFFSSGLFIGKGFMTESFILILIGQTLFFVALFVLFGLKGKTEIVKNKK